MYTYDTATQAISDLMRRGYDVDFNIDENDGSIKGEHLNRKGLIKLKPEDFEIDEMYRFEGNSDPGDEMVIYAIHSKRYNVRGVLVNAFGPYSDPGASDVIKKLSSHIQYQLN